MATEGWQHARDGVVQLWQRFRPEAAQTVADELEETRTVALAVQETGVSVVERALQEEWARQITDLLVSYPNAEGGVRELLAGWSLSDQRTAQGSVHLEAHGTGSARIYQAGRDQHITER
ncbi:hypothetical protein ABZX88_01955 [Kitasatospora aureofaciens]|uniref:hypothetical protein n=1 Tax=Kitasatospora aureofaciens TaxID=1894 RepID=UPI0033A9666F